MASTLNEWLALDAAGKAHAMSKLQQEPEDQSPEEQQATLRLAVELSQFARTPEQFLLPAQAEVQRQLRGTLPDIQAEFEAAFGTNLPPGAEARKREIHALMLTAMLRPYARLQKMQAEIEEIMRRNRESRYFDITVFLAAINKHLERTPKFLPMAYFCPSMDLMLAQLTAMHRRAPEAHAKVIFKLVQASMWQEEPHPRPCSCPLCSHIAGLANS